MPGIYGLTWEPHFVAVAPASSPTGPLTGWWITGYDREGFGRATIHVPDARSIDDHDVSHELVMALLGVLRGERDGDAVTP